VGGKRAMARIELNPQIHKEILSKRSERGKHFDLGNGLRRAIFHCKPIHYKPKGKITWEDIDLDFQDDGKGNWIADKNKVSVGFRKDLKLEKYFGLRYDYEHQFEATIKEIKLDRQEQATSNKVSSLKRDSKTEISHQLNPEIEIINRINEVSLKNFVKVSNPIEDFKIVEELHLKGLTCSNKKEGNKYIPDKYGRFNFIDEKGELKFWINPPFFEDAKEERYQSLAHALQEIDGHLIYTKTPTEIGKDDLILAKYPILIDTNTYYSSTADGLVDGNEESSWEDAYNSTTGTVDDTGHQNGAAMRVYNTGKGSYKVTRSFFYFNTSDLPDAATITSAVLKLYYYYYGQSDVSAQQGTQADTLESGDIDSFSGNEWGHSSGWSEDQYNSITFNAAGKSAINKTGITKVCCREYTHDYLNSEPDDYYANGCYFANEELTTKDPKLEIDYTEAEGPANVKSVNGVAIADVKSINGIAKASIKSINGIT